MSGLDLDRLKKNQEAILKAEIISMLALWKKILPNTGINKTDKNINDIDWQSLLAGINITFKNIDNTQIKSFDIWNNFLNNWRSWRKQNSPDYILQILYGISESLNSGIDKGSPNENIKVEPENERWLANAFGSFKRKIIYLEKDKNEINDIIDEIKNKIKHIFISNNFLSELEEVRNIIKSLFSGLLSDDRFPINDVSLWEQTYMPTSMFKALLSNYVLTHSDFNEIPDRQKVKWRILGIQYVKVGVAEKSLKLASISWYREITEKIDKEIKNLLEVEYPIGNEIYRDETGIYFIVGEYIGEDLNDGSNLAELKKDLREIEDKILEKFKDLTNDEFYPAIFLTKASRGLMNLSTLLEKAKENFLKANWKKKDGDLCLVKSINGKAIGICPVCQVRLIYEKDKEKQNRPTICEVCDNRIYHKQVSKWINNFRGETIWLDEIKDKNDRVAYVSLKFELDDWLNGNLLNSLLVRSENFEKYKNNIISAFNILIQNLKSQDVRSLNITDSEERIFENFFELYDRSGIYEPFKGIKDVLKTYKNLVNISNEKGWQDLAKNLLAPKWIKEYYSFYNSETNEIVKNKKKNIQIELTDKYIEDNGVKTHLYKIFILNYFMYQVYNTLLERSTGQKWEEFIYKQLDDWDSKNNEPKKQKIDFDKREIYWGKLDDNDFEFLATLLLQFLLRKNPSPARLRRIWETTREFFEKIHKELDRILKIPEWRKKRLVWEVNLDDNNKLEKSKELEAEGLLFWAEKEKNKAKVYLISNISDFLEKFGNNEVKKALKNSEKLNIEEAILKDEETFKNNNYIQSKKNYS